MQPLGMTAIAVLFALLSAGTACGKAEPEQALTTDALANAVARFPEDTSVEGESWPEYRDARRRAFEAEFAALARVGDSLHMVLYPAEFGRRVDRPRSSYPRSDSLYADSAYGLDDQVLVRVRPRAGTGSAFYVLFTAGMSADPGFYSIRERDGARGEIIWGEALAFVRPDSARLYQRTNSTFPRRRTLVVRDGILEAVHEDPEPVDLASVVLGSLTIRRSATDTTVLERLSRGDSIWVLSARNTDGRGGELFLVRSARGSQGWVRLDGRQCPASVVRGICFYGD